MPQQPAEEAAAANVVRIFQHCIHRFNRRTGRIERVDWRACRCLRNRSIPQALVRPMGVVEVSVLTFDVVEMAEAKAHEMVQAFPLERADPRFHERVGIRREQRRSDGYDAGASKQFVERERKLRVAVVKNELGPELLFIQPARVQRSGSKMLKCFPFGFGGRF